MNIDERKPCRCMTPRPGRQRARLFPSLMLVIVYLQLFGCGSAVSRLNDQARRFALETIVTDTNGFTLRSFHHPAGDNNQSLHVYLEGDGRPWERGVLPATEPTTRASVALPLMALDPAPALYLGRPCYNGHAADAGCHPALWTDSRYSELIVNTMARALGDFCRERGYRDWILIGHSGGGSLALLLAERLPATRAVVTLAGNYDIDAWTDYHDYQRLSGSLNPAERPGLNIPEWHILGKHDSNTPPSLFEQALRQRKNSTIEIIDADHTHGWEQFWPGMLARLAQLRR